MKRMGVIVFLAILIIQPTLADAFINDQLYKRHQLQQQGSQLAKKGRYKEAIEKFREALDPKYIQDEDDKAFSLGKITQILVLLEEYDQALKEYEWFVEQSEKNSMRQGVKNNGKARLRAEEIKALKAYQETGDSAPIQEYIKRYQERNAKSLPPDFQWGVGSVEVSTVLRLYDTIGDYDAGVKYVDEIMGFLQQRKKSRKEDYKIYERIKTADEAKRCADDNKPAKDRHPEWRACKIIFAYLSVREGFEHDKQYGRLDCKGESVCLGSATKALIDSDYFPW
ncbi:MAG: hypothetical protein WCU74_08560 [Candidatus Omnitrophota bacterium]|jgi:tetratricopeptide (TPR) repeat protein